MEKAEEDFRRREMIRERQLKQYSVLKQKKEEAEDRRCVGLIAILNITVTL